VRADPGRYPSRLKTLLQVPTYPTPQTPLGTIPTRSVLLGLLLISLQDPLALLLLVFLLVLRIRALRASIYPRTVARLVGGFEFDLD
jgi:hypothetical protein